MLVPGDGLRGEHYNVLSDTLPDLHADAAEIALAALPLIAQDSVEDAKGFDLLILRRSAAVVEAFGGFRGDRHFTVDQVRFVKLIVDELTSTGVMDPGRLDGSPFTDHAPTGPDFVFKDAIVDILGTIEAPRSAGLKKAATIYRCAAEQIVQCAWTLPRPRSYHSSDLVASSAFFIHAFSGGLAC